MIKECTFNIIRLVFNSFCISEFWLISWNSVRPCCVYIWIIVVINMTRTFQTWMLPIKASCRNYNQPPHALFWYKFLICFSITFSFFSWFFFFLCVLFCTDICYNQLVSKLPARLFSDQCWNLFCWFKGMLVTEATWIQS